jgi:GntR family transcriptional regulator
MNRRSPVPLYRQLRALLGEEILTGQLRPGDRLPSESELVSSHGVSRITVRQALQALEVDGLVVRTPGKGTFVGEGRKVARLARLTGFGENIRAVGQTPGYRTLAVTPIIDPVHATRLGLETDDGMLRIERVLLADGVPVALAESFLPVRLLGNAAAELTPEVLDRSSLYGLVAEKAGLVLARAAEEVEPVAAGSNEAGLLDISEGALLLRVRRITYDPQARAFEDVTIHYCPDRYSFRLELERGV